MTIKTLDGTRTTITTEHKNVISKDIVEAIDNYVIEIDGMIRWHTQNDVDQAVMWLDMAFTDAAILINNTEQPNIICDSRNNKKSTLSKNVRVLCVKFKQKQALIQTELNYRIKF